MKLLSRDRATVPATKRKEAAQKSGLVMQWESLVS